MPKPVIALKSHIDTLLLYNSIDVEWREKCSGRAYRKSRRVRLQYIKSEITYAVALHEIGHILGRHPSVRIDKEVAAWEWARKNALVWTPVMTGVASRSLTTYVRWSRRHQTMKVPGVGHPVFDWVSA